MYDWSRKRIKEFISANSANDFLYIKYTWQMLGLSKEKYYDKQCRELLYDWLKIRREVDLNWTKSSDNSVFKETELDELNKYTVTNTTPLLVEVTKEHPETKEIVTYPYAFTQLKPIKKEKAYFIGCDVAGGLGKDSSTIIVTDPDDNFREVATFKSNTINIANYTLLLIEFILTHCPKSILFIENNSYGKGVIDNLLEHPKLCKQIYYEYKIADKDKTKSNPGTVTDSITYGINTNPVSRKLMTDLILEVVRENPEFIVSEAVYNDIKGLVYAKSGKIEHDSSSHDDSLFGLIMVRYAVRYGNNIAKFLRDAASVKRNLEKINSLTKNGVFNKHIDDPAVNKGIQVNLEDITRLLNAGESIEDVMKHVREFAEHKKGKPINKNIMNQLFARK